MGNPTEKTDGDSGLPLRLAEDEQFAIARSLLRGSEFNEPRICQRLKLSHFDQVLGLSQAEAVLSEPSDRLGVLIRLFLLREALRIEELRPVLPAEGLEALQALGLLTSLPADRCLRVSPVALYPVGDLFVVSDRWFSPEGGSPTPPQDFVFPAITANTSQFLSCLPVTPCEHLLDICAGTGVAALWGARHAKRAWATDITERSTWMAEFNRKLNGLENVTALRGDLYEPVGDLKFDRIVAHPPYMPAPTAAQIFYDGGTDGEQITRRIVQGLPQHLLPGGRLYCLTMGSDREGRPFEGRIREWLGAAEAEFDVGLVVRKFYRPGELALRWAVKTTSGPDGASAFKKALTDLGIEAMAYGWMLIQRKAEDRKVFTIRRQAGARCGKEEIAGLLEWETAVVRPGVLGHLADAQPAVNPSVEFRSVHKLKEGNILQEELTVYTDHPFEASCKAQPWVPQFMTQCDGKATARELHKYCIQNELINSETPLEEFLKLLVVLISGGFLEVGSPLFPSFPSKKTIADS